MVINNKKHRLAEIEFYFNSQHFQDPYPHGDVVQQTCGSWYFHKTNGRYRDG